MKNRIKAILLFMFNFACMWVGTYIHYEIIPKLDKQWWTGPYIITIAGLMLASTLIGLFSAMLVLDPKAFGDDK